MTSIAECIAEELRVRLPQVQAAIALLDDKATVPFIARYRKEATGGLDDTQLRTLDERLTYLRELEERRAAILKSIDEQGKLTPELAAAIATPRPRRGSRISTCPSSRSAAPRRRLRARPGSSRWPSRCSQNPTLVPDGRGRGVRQRGQGCRRRRCRARRRALDSDGDVRGRCGARRRAAQVPLGSWRMEIDGGSRQGRRRRQVLGLLRRERTVQERAVASHRSRCFAAATEGVLRLAVTLPDDDRRAPARPSPSGASRRASASRTRDARPTAGSSRPCARPGRSGCWRTSRPRSNSAFARRPRRKRSACSAATCTTCCWRRLPASASRWASIPGIRTGVKVAVVDGTGKLLETATVYPHAPRNDWEGVDPDARGAVRAAWRAARRDRQRHRVARDRQARRRVD